MTPKVFFTGATGFIGGDILYEITHEHPDWEITCLVRSREKGEKILHEYPNVRITYGSNASTDIIEAESEKADMVIHSAISDEDAQSAEAIGRGLSRSGGAFLHTSGGLGLAGKSTCLERYGVDNGEEFDDWTGIEKLINRPVEYPHAKVDHIALNAGIKNPETVKVAIISPCVVYGPGRGPCKTYTMPIWVPFLQFGRVFKINEGTNSWNYIHIQDLSKLYRLLAEDYLAGCQRATWNSEGYYLAENGKYILKEMLQLGAQIGYDRKYFNTPEVETFDVMKAEELFQYSRYMLGADSQGNAIRGRELLGWKPTQLSYTELLPQMIDANAKLARR